ncbi:MAG: ATP-binding cassette domain-containing protein [Bacteroidales bacterium]
MEYLNKWKWNILSVSLFLLLWQLLALSLNNDFLFPSVHIVAKSLLGLSGSAALYNNLLATFLRAIEGLFFSFIVALPLSYLISRSQILEKLVTPFLYFMKNTPVVSFLLLALIWIPSQSVPLFIAFVGMLPILVINFTSGFRSVERKYIDLALLYRLSFLRRFLYIEFPAVKNYIFTGLSSALGLGWRAIIIGEVLASVEHGLGAAMKEAQSYVDVAYLFSVTFISLLVSYLFELCIEQFARIRLHRLIKPVHSTREIPEDSSVPPLLISDLSFERRGNVLFDHFSLQITPGEVLLLKGRSGVGKSTLINIIGGFQQNYQGSVISAEKSILFQDQRLCPWLTVRENIDLILPVQVTTEEKQTMYQIMGIEHLMNCLPGQISGGEAQRVSLCRALLYPAGLYILDEPLTGIGEVQKKNLLQWIRAYVKQKKVSVLWISHDKDQADIADRVVRI